LKGKENEYGAKEGTRQCFDRDKGWEERVYGMKIRSKSFPVEFQRAFSITAHTKATETIN
jgi:hypothetical protein